MRMMIFVGAIVSLFAASIMDSKLGEVGDLSMYSASNIGIQNCADIWQGHCEN